MSLAEIALSIFTLSALEIVLGVDNLVFIALAVARLQQARQRTAWRFGLGVACVARLGLLGMVDWLSECTRSVVQWAGHSFSGRDLILLCGGLFLLFKGIYELGKLRLSHREAPRTPRAGSLIAVIFQIVLLDLVFSIDSVITAVALVDSFWVMATAILLSIGLMLAASERLSRLIKTYPRLKTLGLGFLLLIGAVLTLDGLGWHLPRSYLYAAMGFALFVEALHLGARTPTQSVFEK